MDGQSLHKEVNRLIAEKHNPAWMCDALTRSVVLARSRAPGGISMEDVAAAFVCIMEKEAATYWQTYGISYTSVEPQREIHLDRAAPRRPLAVSRRGRRR